MESLPGLTINLQGLVVNAGTEFTQIFGSFWPVVAIAAAIPGFAGIIALLGFLARIFGRAGGGGRYGGWHDDDF